MAEQIVQVTITKQNGQYKVITMNDKEILTASWFYGETAAVELLKVALPLLVPSNE